MNTSMNLSSEYRGSYSIENGGSQSQLNKSSLTQNMERLENRVQEILKKKEYNRQILVKQHLVKEFERVQRVKGEMKMNREKYERSKERTGFGSKSPVRK